uniref:Uncharacterized protein n=1 Tax=Opuntia streptacantha TaxID=393608 RepID=A0A7C9EIW5_OPUST
MVSVQSMPWLLTLRRHLQLHLLTLLPCLHRRRLLPLLHRLLLRLLHRLLPPLVSVGISLTAQPARLAAAFLKYSISVSSMAAVTTLMLFAALEQTTAVLVNTPFVQLLRGCA